MTQEEKWMMNYVEAMGYLKENHRNPSKYDLDVRRIYTWIKHQRKVMNAGGMRPERVTKFEKLQELAEQYKRVNQYQ